MRFDITDPMQRRARYGLLAGMWAFFFALFGVEELALLLGVLALYWGGSSLRDGAGATGRRNRGSGGSAGAGGDGGDSGPGRQGEPAKPHFLPAVSGILAGCVALTMVFGLFATQLAYRDYFDCVSDALTSKARASCDEKLPDWLEPWAKMRG